MSHKTIQDIFSTQKPLDFGASQYGTCHSVSERNTPFTRSKIIQIAICDPDRYPDNFCSV